MLLLSTLTAVADLPKLIPRETLFGVPPKAWPKLSPDGKRLAYIAADDRGVANIWAQPTDGGEPKLLTHERRPVWDFNWSSDGTRIFFGQDGDGDENRHVFSADFATGNIRDLTPFRGVRVQNYAVDADHPGEILVELNLRDRKLFDVHRVNLETGAIVLEAQNPGDVNSWMTDSDFVVRGATAFDTNGQTIVRVRDNAKAPWRDLLTMPFEQAPFMGQIAGGSVIAGFAADGKSLYVASALHSNTARIERIDARTGATLEVVAEHPKSDPGEVVPEVMFDPRTDAIQAVRFLYQTSEWRFLDKRFGEDLDSIARQTGRFARVISRSADDARWVVSTESGNAPNSYYTYDRATKKLTLLFDEGEALKGYTLATPKPVLLRARDGRELVSYLTLPPGTSGRNLPLVLLTHGGPWARDSDRYDPEVQFLANRGYAVLQVNFRGSTGLGLDYYNSGNRQVGLAMIDDILDGVRWAVAQGIADPKRIVAYGASMGGYASVRAITQEPEMFSCAVDYVGITELRSAVAAFPPYWVAARNRWLRRMGDVLTDDALNRKLSPFYDVAKIRVPILVASGANDVRARLEHAEIFVKALRDAKRDVTFVVYPDEGHGFGRPENNFDYYGRVEEFLAHCAGGRAEPWKKVEGSSAEVR
jgi:dipeptidyl aminopeptidase/acylaminoacyl peptidase